MGFITLVVKSYAPEQMIKSPPEPAPAIQHAL
jgi:hypothetical protein